MRYHHESDLVIEVAGSVADLADRIAKRFCPNVLPSGRWLPSSLETEPGAEPDDDDFVIDPTNLEELVNFAIWMSREELFELGIDVVESTEALRFVDDDFSVVGYQLGGTPRQHPVQDFDVDAYAHSEAYVTPRQGWYLHTLVTLWFDLHRSDPGQFLDDLPPICRRLWDPNGPEVRRLVEESMLAVANRLATGQWNYEQLAHNMAEQVIVGRLLDAIGDRIADEALATPETCGVDLPVMADDADSDWPGLVDVLLMDTDHELLWSLQLDGIESSDDALNQHLGLGDLLHPSHWWDTFGGIDPHV